MPEPRTDLLYVAYNRLEFTTESFQALIRNTDWSLVRRLFVHDDGSTDGTAEYLDRIIDELHCDVTFRSERVGGPVAATNWYLEETAADPIEIFGKIDNDFVVCPGWLNEMLRVIDQHPALDILGTEPFVGGPEPDLVARFAELAELDGSVLGDRWPIDQPCWLESRTITEASHIGGKGLIRRRAFEYARSDRMWADGYQGFTQWQHRNEHVTKAWITPDLPCFGLDQIPVERWQAITDRYEEGRLQRRWPAYHPNSTYHLWWTPVGEVAS